MFARHWALWEAVWQGSGSRALEARRPFLGGPGRSWNGLETLEVGRHATCAIDVEGLKRRPPSKVGGLCHEFRL